MPEDRGAGINLPAPQVGLPPRVFLFTIDQISVMVNITEAMLKKDHIYFENRSTGSRLRRLMVARNVADPARDPDWRITEREFIRWMRLKGFRYYDRGAFSN